jgi:hypothetical protein
MKNISFQKFQQIHNAGFTLDHVYLLIQIEAGIDVRTLCGESLKLGTLHHSIYRKGFITLDDKLTLTGKEFISFINQEEEVVPEITYKKKKPDVNDFDLWWKSYPPTDTFSHKGKTFTGTRAMKVKKDECKVKFNRILEEGEYTAQELIEALKFEVEQKKDNSVKEKTNKLKFMQNSLTYLNQRTFEPFIELIRSGVSLVEQPENTGGTDI